MIYYNDFPQIASTLYAFANKNKPIRGLEGVTDDISTQPSFFKQVFCSYFDTLPNDEKPPFGFDSSRLSDYLRGRRNLPKPLLSFCFAPANREHLIEAAEYFLEWFTNDIDDLVAALRQNLLAEQPQSTTRVELADSKAYATDLEGNAAFVVDALLYAMSRPSLLRDKNGDLTVSPIILDQHFVLHHPPKPPASFVGRDDDLHTLDKELKSSRQVNLSGPPGSGKSALAAAHISSSDYKNILWLTYTGDLRRDIAQLERIDNATLNTLDDRYDANMRILSRMASDSLIVIDQYDASTPDAALPLLLGLSCRVLVVSRHPLSDYDCAHVCLDAIADIDDCLNIFQHYYKATDAYRHEITDIIQITHHHTTVMVLCGKLLQDGAVTPNALLAALRESSALPSHTDIIPLSKDGLMATDTYIGHISTLLGLAKLSRDEAELLRVLSVIHLGHAVTDLQIRHLLRLDNLNWLNALIRKGLIDKDPDDRTLSISPLVAHVAITVLHPDPYDCVRMISLVSSTIAAYQAVYGTIRNVMSIPYLADDPAAYCDCLDCSIYCVLKHHDYATASQYLQQMASILDSGQVTRDDIIVKYLAAAVCLSTDLAQAGQALATATHLADTLGADISAALINMHINIANQYIGQGRYDEATQHLEQCVDLHAASGQARPIDMLAHDISMAYVYAGWGQYDDCRNILDELADVEIRAEYGAGTPAYIEAASIKYSIGSLYCYLGDYDRAQVLFDAAADLYDIIYADCPDVAHDIRDDMQAMLQGQPLRFAHTTNPALPAKILASLSDTLPDS